MQEPTDRMKMVKKDIGMKCDLNEDETRDAPIPKKRSILILLYLY